MCCARLPIEMLLRGNGAGIWEGRESEALELGLIGGARVSGALSQSPAAYHAARFVCSRAPLQVRNSQATRWCGVTARLAPQMAAFIRDSRARQTPQSRNSLRNVSPLHPDRHLLWRSRALPGCGDLPVSSRKILQSERP